MNTSPGLTGGEQHLLTQLYQTSRLLLACLVLQLPFGLWQLVHGAPAALLNLLFHASLIAVVLHLCAGGTFYTARTLLLAGFMSFVTFASVIWSQQPGIPYFLLLGAVTCVFFFRRKEKAIQRLWAIGFAVMFVLLSMLAIPPESLLVEAVYTSNTLTLAGASLLILYTLDNHNKRRWLHLVASQRHMQERLRSQQPPISFTSRQPGQTLPVKCCAVLFADMAGFKSLTSQLDDEDIVCVLNALYQRFDQQAQLAGICRIKTNGDEYMAALSQAFDARKDQPDSVADDMLRFAQQISQDFQQIVKEFAIDVELRIGIAMGPVRAGIIGSQRPAFDIWGRTVNLASVLEQISQPDFITVCPQFYSHLSEVSILPTTLSGVPLPDGPGFALQIASRTELNRQDCHAIMRGEFSAE